FFFQAEDGIRDLTVTGVQTCALPISINEAVGSSEAPVQALATAVRGAPTIKSLQFTPREGVTLVIDDDFKPVEPGSGVEGWLARSEERRVGKEGGCTGGGGEWSDDWT